MKTITIGTEGNEREVSQEEFVKLNKYGDDELTEFLPTREDLKVLAGGLIQEVGNSQYFLGLTVSRRDIAADNWVRQRWARLIDYMETMYPKEVIDDYTQKMEAECKKAEEQAEEVLSTEEKSSGAYNTDQQLVDVALAEIDEALQEGETTAYVGGVEKEGLRQYAKEAVAAYMNDNIRAECWNKAISDVVDKLMVPKENSSGA